jgi:hypothetical protein
VEGSCDNGNKASESIKCWEVLEYPHNWLLLKKCSALRSWSVSWLQNLTMMIPFCIEPLLDVNYRQVDTSTYRHQKYLCWLMGGI